MTYTVSGGALNFTLLYLFMLYGNRSAVKKLFRKKN